MNGRKINIWDEAYFIVEASALMPLIIALYFFFIYSLLYVYNLTLLNQDTYYLCEKVREAVLENEDGETEAETILKIIKDESPYLSCKDLTMSYSKSGHKIAIEGNLEFVVPVKSYINKWFASWDKCFSISHYVYITKPQNIMRMSYKFDSNQEEK